MSWKVTTRVIDTSKNKGSKLLLLIMLADAANEDGYCWPGIQRLAQQTRMSTRQVQRMLQDLAKDGEIFIETRKGGIKNNRYHVICGLDIEQKREIANQIIEKFPDLHDDILSSLGNDKMSSPPIVDDDNLSSGDDIAMSSGNDTAMSLKPLINHKEPIREKDIQNKPLDPTVVKSWNDLKIQMKSQTGYLSRAWRTEIEPMQLIDFQDNAFIVSAPKDKIPIFNSRYKQTMDRLAMGVLNSTNARVVFSVPGPQT